MRTVVKVTDQSWYEFLAARPDLKEANFWLPGGGPKRYGELRPGEPLLFKTHHPHNRLVGGGFLSDYRRLPLSLAWEAFGEANGVGSLAELRRRIGGYRKAPVLMDDDPMIGCIMLRDVAFAAADETLPAPDDFASNIVSGKGYSLDANPNSVVELAFERLLLASPMGLMAEEVRYLDLGPTRGQPRLTTPRLGQSAFSAVVQEAYEMRCAITGAKIRPALQAAHIKPVADEGQHRVDNGLLLRADVHIMFDQGYLGVHPKTGELQVSSRLRSTFGNGEEFYALQGHPIAVPERRSDRPNVEFLEWHMDKKFEG